MVPIYQPPSLVTHLFYILYNFDTTMNGHANGMILKGSFHINFPFEVNTIELSRSQCKSVLQGRWVTCDYIKKTLRLSASVPEMCWGT